MIDTLKNIKRNITYWRKGYFDIQGDLDKIILHPMAIISSPQKLTVANYVRIGQDCHIDALGGVTLEMGVTLSPRVVILSSNHNYKNTRFIPFDETEVLRPVVIKEGAWIAWGAIILPGVIIGKHAIITAGSVVTSDVPDNQIYGSPPAAYIKDRPEAQDRNTHDSEEEKYYQYHVVEKGMRRS